VEYIQIINCLLKERNITGAKMSRDLGFSSGSFSQWQKGRSKMSVDSLVKIAEYLSVSTDYLLGRNEPKQQIISPLECKVITAYRDQPQMQPAVNRLLGLEEEETQPQSIVSVYKAARSDDNRRSGVEELPRSTIEKLRSARETDEI
jgi:transcriptional regulator with XRE-family HTH domain